MQRLAFNAGTIIMDDPMAHEGDVRERLHELVRATGYEPILGSEIIEPIATEDWIKVREITHTLLSTHRREYDEPRNGKWKAACRVIPPPDRVK